MKHGEGTPATSTPEYRAWRNMRSRARYHPRYQGLGVADRWEDFRLFLADMGRRPSPKHTLVRIDGTKGYAPENCRWATRGEQAVNRKSTVYLTDGVTTLPSAYWAKRLGVSKGLLTHWKKKGELSRFGLSVVDKPPGGL